MLDVPAGRGSQFNQLPNATVANLCALLPVARFVIRCRPAAIETIGQALRVSLPQTACRASVASHRAALWLGPDEWLLLADEADAPEIAGLSAGVLSAVPHSLVEVSHGYAGLTIAGPQAASVLNHGCPLELSLSAFPVGMCTRTILGKAEIVLWRRAAEMFHIEMGRSFSAYVWRFLEEARCEYKT
jgi:sarcosine oxidase, subunit gamma